MSIRPAAVAGSFYSGNREQLQHDVDGYLAHPGVAIDPPQLPSKAMILPHAGYIYSGEVAASGYQLLLPHVTHYKRVLLLGPSHRVAFRGIASCSHSAYQTPLGSVAIETDLVRQLEQSGLVTVSDEAHWQEHSLEVHIPFLQRTLPDCRIIPLVVGDASAEEVMAVITHCTDNPEIASGLLIIVSSDLSHFHSYDEASKRDQATARAIEQLNLSAIGSHDACGSRPVKGLLLTAQQRGLHCTTLDLRNSGDTAGDHSRVVGYGAFEFH